MGPSVLEWRRQGRAIRALLKVSLATAMQYRSNFLFELSVGLLRDLSRAAPLALVFWHRDSVGGWELPEALLVMAFFLLLSGFQSGIFEPNLGEAVESIRSGTLDLLLMKPVDAQLLVSLRKFTPAAVWDLVAGVVVGGVALWVLPAPAPVDVLLAIGLFSTGVVAMYCLWLLAICMSFFFIRVDNLRFLLWAISDAGRWPIDVFSGMARFLLTAIIPVALITSFPADALRGTWTVDILFVSSAVTLAFVFGSRWAWNRSLANYTSASS
jgi:ABC-2 type transport system permease protein